MKKKIIIVVSIVTLIALCLINVFIINQKQLKIRQVTIESEKIDPSFDNYVIAFFSDTYFDRVDSSILEKVISSINTYSPDVVIFGGDLIENSTNIKRSELVEQLNMLKSKNGKYAVLGENDKNFSKKILVDSGFKILDNSSVQIYSNSNELINIVGLENMINAKPNASNAYSKVSSNHFVFTVCHTPDIVTTLPTNKTDYFVGGHSLGGEIYLPIINNLLREKGAENYYRGSYTLDNTTVDVTNGVGHKNKSVRLLADAEIVIYKLKTIYD